MSTDDSRPAKRTRQACEQCRRKKSRCPGERPACSYCQRLGQPCEYAGEEEPDYAKKMEQRISGIEGKLETLMECFSNQRQLLISSPTATLHSRPPAYLERAPKAPVTPLQPESSIARTAVELFHTYCNFQPLPLFHHESFLLSSDTREPELLLAIQALGLRFSGGGVGETQVDQQIKDWAESSRCMVTTRLTEGTTELCTLQALCLLTLIDYTSGNTMRAGVNFRLSIYLLQNLKFRNTELSNLENEHDERILWRWSLHMLGNLLGDPPSTTTRTLPSLASIQGPSINKKDLGLVGCAIQLSEVWEMARSYAATPVKPDSPPPWSPQSDYSRITFRHTEFESITPLKYRLHETRFDELSGDELQQHREFWGHWLFFQLVFHSIPCLLNHPLLLSTRLRNFRHTMPQSFLRHSFEQITLHAGWILHFLDLLESKNFQVTDPTLGQCVVIVATIYLQHSFSEDVIFREKAQIGYDKCISFLQGMALRWPILERQVDNLHRLKNSISAGGVQSSRQIWSVNIHLLWEILVWTTPKDRSDNVFGPGLAKDSTSFTDPSTPDPDFALIGSAGISGHKTVVRELVTYYPPDQMMQPTPPDISALLGDPGLGLSGSANNDFLQPQDYGRFIDNWLTLPS